MDYEIVTLEQKTIVGLSARTGNTQPDMSAVIGGLWQKFFGEGLMEKLPGRVNEHTIGLYSDYEEGVNGKYDITVGCEVETAAHIPQNMTVKTIPGGHYARFVICGDMVQAVAKAWEEIWAMDLARTWSADFEEYVSCNEDGTCEIHLYIAVE